MKSLFFPLMLLFATFAYAQTMEDTTGKALYVQFVEEKNIAQSEQQFHRLLMIRENNPQSFAATRNKSMLYSAMVRKYFEAGVYNKIEQYVDSVNSPLNRMALLLEAAQSILKNEKSTTADLQYAKKFAETAVSWRKKDMEERSTKDLRFVGADKKMYAGYADTYASILMKLNNYTEAYPYAEDAAKFADMKEMGYTERYAILLAKTKPVSISKPELEKLMSEGLLTANAKEALKEVYLKEHNNLKGYKEYIAKYEAASTALREKELAKEMIKQPAPSFKLKDLKGNTISLNKLKGKTVILDFWATWCQPCIKAFPVMQKTINRHQNDPNVVFLFINTQESGITVERTKKVNNFFKKDEFKKYNTFRVVMDTDNSVAKAYGVTGIPAKFVIDPKGNICFSGVGNTEKEEAAIETLSVMIKMASKR